MRERPSGVLGMVILLFLLAIDGSGQTAQDVLTRMINALGGRRALSAIRDTTMRGSVELAPSGITAAIIVRRKEPDKLRIDLDVSGMTIAMGFDGRAGWIADPYAEAIQEMEESRSRDLAHQALGNRALLEPGQLGISYALRANERFNGREYIALEQALADGHRITFFLDPETFLPYKAKTRAVGRSGEEVDIETYYSDYREVGKVVIAHAIRTVQNGVEAQRLTIAEVVRNTGLDDSLFQRR